MNKIDSFQEYLALYEDKYSTSALDVLKAYFYVDKGNDLFLQVKSKLGLLKENEDRYQGFIKHLDEFGFLKGKILEVGAGFYPILAERLADISGIEITAIDPTLVTTDIPKVKLIKDKFPDAVNIDDYDSLISMLPCEVTLSIIELANKYHKPFSIMLCECAPPVSIVPIRYDKWQDYLVSKTREMLDDGAELSESYLAKSYHSPYKILTKKYKK